MKNRLLLYAAISAFAVPHLSAEEVKEWTLQQCISHALAHNLTIQRQEDNVKMREISVSTSKNSRLPDLSGSAGENLSFGRALTADNTYANHNTNSTSFGLSTSVPLLEGGRIHHTQAVDRLNLKAALQDQERTKLDVTLNVISVYLEAVCQKDLVEVAESQVALSGLQVQRMKSLFENGKASKADLAQIENTLASDELSLTQQRNSYMLSLLTLSQLLELDTPEGFDVARPAIGDIPECDLPSPDVVYAEAIGIKPQVLAEETRLQTAQRNVQVAKSALFPSLYLNAGLGSSFYKTSGFQAQSFGKQMRENFSQYMGISLSVPIFNRFATRNNIRAARVQVHAQELQVLESKKELYKEIQQAYYNAVASQRQCESSEVAQHSAQEAFDLIQKKYENGKATSTEFQEAKTNLQRAESNWIQSRYTFLFRQKILDFYRGLFTVEG